jgi:hypothetical protein
VKSSLEEVADEAVASVEGLCEDPIQLLETA